jgi:hypothetical protein
LRGGRGAFGRTQRGGDQRQPGAMQRTPPRQPLGQHFRQGVDAMTFPRHVASYHDVK